jgi:regulatory protein YycH of two-component signal transduction system YycFG
MNFDIKTVLPYLVILTSLAMTWGMWSERLEAVETKANTISEMQQDIAVIKEKIIWIEKYLNGN